MKKIIEDIKNLIDKSDNKLETINELRKAISALSPQSTNPVDFVQWIPLEKVIANDYNPNTVAINEMKLLYTSIQHDGYTQPVVTIYDKDQDKYIIVDGFHRYLVSKNYKDIYERCNGCLPCVVIDKDINERMASTVRHNRARGKHSVVGMSDMVFQLLDNGWSDEEVCNELGLEADELLRLKHITGFSKLFSNIEYTKSWETKRQIKLRKDWENEHKDGSQNA